MGLLDILQTPQDDAASYGYGQDVDPETLRQLAVLRAHQTTPAPTMPIDQNYWTNGTNRILDNAQGIFNGLVTQVPKAQGLDYGNPNYSKNLIAYTLGQLSPIHGGSGPTMATAGVDGAGMASKGFIAPPTSLLGVAGDSSQQPTDHNGLTQSDIDALNAPLEARIKAGQPWNGDSNSIKSDPTNTLKTQLKNNELSAIDDAITGKIPSGLASDLKSHVFGMMGGKASVYYSPLEASDDWFSKQPAGVQEQVKPALQEASKNADDAHQWSAIQNAVAVNNPGLSQADIQAKLAQIQNVHDRLSSTTTPFESIHQMNASKFNSPDSLISKIYNNMDTFHPKNYAQHIDSMQMGVGSSDLPVGPNANHPSRPWIEAILKRQYGDR